MGRRKTYDRDVLISKSMEIFRDYGFAGTSTQMLVEELGVNRYSLYAEFGSKQALFDAALGRYDVEVVERNFGPLQAPNAGAAEIVALFEFFAKASTGPAAGRGCLLCNTAVEFGPTDPSGSEFVARYFARISSAFTQALGNAKETGDLKGSVDVAKESSFFTAAVLGLFVMIRAVAPAKVVKNASGVAMQHLESLKVRSSYPG